MTNNLTHTERIFESEEFGQIRAIFKNGEPWFVAKDVAEALGYKDTVNAIKTHIANEDKQIIQRWRNTTFEIPPRGLTFTNESGVYSLIFGSKLPSAQRFKRWVTHDVLPEIRQTGSYNSISLRNSNGQLNVALIREILDDEERLQKQVEQQQLQIEQQQTQIDKMELKCDYYDKIMSDNNVMCVTPIAKDYGMSATELNKLLHTYGVQYKIDNQWILYQQYADKGYTKSVSFEPKYYNGVVLQTRWTQKGRKFIYELLKEHGILPILERNSTPVLTVING